MWTTRNFKLTEIVDIIKSLSIFVYSRKRDSQVRLVAKIKFNFAIARFQVLQFARAWLIENIQKKTRKSTKRLHVGTFSYYFYHVFLLFIIWALSPCSCCACSHSNNILTFDISMKQRNTTNICWFYAVPQCFLPSFSTKVYNSNKTFSLLRLTLPFCSKIKIQCFMFWWFGTQVIIILTHFHILKLLLCFVQKKLIDRGLLRNKFKMNNKFFYNL